MKIFGCFDRRERRWRKERVEHGVSEADAWDLHVYLNEVIARGVQQLADNLHGCPSRLADEANGDVEEGCRRWKAILEEIVAGFEAELKAQAAFEPSPPDFENALNLLSEFWRDLWD